MTMTRRLLILMAAGVLASGCDLGGDINVDVNNTPPITSQSSIVDAHGNPVSSLPATAPVQLQVANLPPNQRFAIVLTDAAGNELSPPGGYTIQSDEEGRIPASTIVQNLDQLVAAKHGVIPKDGGGHAFGTFQVQVHSPGGGSVGHVSFTVTDTARVFCANPGGAEQGSFGSGEHVFARIEKGGGTLADGSYHVHVLSDLNPVLADGDSLGAVFATAAVSGGVATVDLGTFAGGAFDVILDVNGNGTFDSATDLISRAPRLDPCFTIQAPPAPQPIVQQICADAAGNFRDVFDPRIGDRDNRDMFAYVTPGRRPQGSSVLSVDKYVVHHKAQWAQGDALADASGGKETDPVQTFCTNEAPWLVWPRQSFMPGCYDIVIDVNRNGVYDVGIDILDNIDSRGNATCGCVVPDTSCADRITISSPAADSTVESTTTQLTGTVVGTPVRGYATVVSGAQSNRIDLTLSGGAFDGRVPLFRGDNLITVTFEYDNGVACSVTLHVVSSPATSATTLFRVQLTWNESADPDIHLVRPPGTHYQNGGGGTDDCNYDNCVVGVDGTDPNDIDWGLPGEDDDPKQDTDCVRCDTPIENIFINQITEDGDYGVYVDQFNDTSTNTVTVFIRDVQVGQVHCGLMESDTATDSCHVGTIRWSGGTSGTGTFIPDGTLASDFVDGAPAGLRLDVPKVKRRK